VDHALGIDLGGTTVKAGVVGADGSIESWAVRPSGERLGAEAWSAVAFDAATEALESAKVPASAIGVSVPGAVDARRSVLLDMAARLPAPEIDLAAMFSRFGLPVRADNDANAALAAERRWGGHEAVADLVLITVGTGIGSAVVVGGMPLGAGRPLAGNLAGHLTIEPDGALCVCGNRGCGETIASASALVDAARRGGLVVAEAADVFDAEARGDRRASDAVHRFLDGLSTIVVNAIHAYRPDVVVLSGGVMARSERILPAVRAAVTERAWTIPPGGVRIAASSLGPAGPVMGAAAIAFAVGTGPPARYP
jgi:glucokinase